MRKANISANIISKIKNGQYMALDKVESLCQAMDCTPNDNRHGFIISARLS